MADIIIVLILIVIAVFALKQTKKHMQGESPCCGGGSGSIKKAKEKHLDGPVMGTKIMKIKGMTCEHCVNNVTNAINKVPGDRKSTRLNSSHIEESRMPSSA